MVEQPPQPPQQLSVLDMLRKRMAREVEGEEQRRVSDLGSALLASRSPNFFTALGEGLAAQEAGTASRMERLRQLAEAERQQRALEGQEAAQRAEQDYRLENLRLRREEAARAGRVQGVPLLNDQNRVVFVNPYTAETIRETNFRSPQELRNQPRVLSEADRANIRNRAEALANSRAGIIRGVTPTPAQTELASRLAEDLFKLMLESAGSAAPAQQSGAAPQTPAARIDALGNPIR